MEYACIVSVIIGSIIAPIVIYTPCSNSLEISSYRRLLGQAHNLWTSRVAFSSVFCGEDESKHRQQSFKTFEHIHTPHNLRLFSNVEKSSFGIFKKRNVRWFMRLSSRGCSTSIYLFAQKLKLWIPFLLYIIYVNDWWKTRIWIRIYLRGKNNKNSSVSEALSSSRYVYRRAHIKPVWYRYEHTSIIHFLTHIIL